MLDRFINYKLTPADYVPNNVHFTNKQPPKPRPPLVAYDKQGREIGFTWNYGDSIYLEFRTTGNVSYDPGESGSPFGFIEDAEAYFNSETPDYWPKHDDNGIMLIGNSDPTSYVDGTCQNNCCCCGCGDNSSSGTEGSDGDSSSETEDPNKNKKMFQILVYNFRYDVVAWCEVPAATEVRVLVDSFYPHGLVKGVYTLELNLIDKNAGIRNTLIDKKDCMLFIN